MTAPDLAPEQQARYDRIEAAPPAPESWVGSLMWDPLRKWLHAEVCDYIPDGGPTCDEMVEGAVAALADVTAQQQDMQ